MYTYTLKNVYIFGIMDVLTEAYSVHYVSITRSP